MGFYKVPLLFIIFSYFPDVGTVSRIEKKNLKKKH